MEFFYTKQLYPIANMKSIGNIIQDNSNFPLSSKGIKYCEYNFLNILLTKRLVMICVQLFYL